MKTPLKFVIVYLLFGLTALYLHLHTTVAVPSIRPLADFPQQQADWRMSSEWTFSANVLNVLKAADYISRQYTDAADNRVTLYVGYHSGGEDSGGIHSPKHCLPGSGWYEVSSQRGTLELQGQRLKLVRSIYQKGGDKELFLYWFQVKGKSLSDEYSLKLAEITNSLLYRRADSAFIRISVPFETDQEKAVALGERFVKDFYPLLQEFLPR
jgi:EpsI family protein